MPDEPKKGEPRPLVIDFGGLELQNGDSVTFDLPIDADAYSRFRDYSVRSVLRMFGGDGYARVPEAIEGEVSEGEILPEPKPVFVQEYPPPVKTIEGEATRIAGELPAPEGEGDG